jgi:hypothetical protein
MRIAIAIVLLLAGVALYLVQPDPTIPSRLVNDPYYYRMSDWPGWRLAPPVMIGIAIVLLLEARWRGKR